MGSRTPAPIERSTSNVTSGLGRKDIVVSSHVDHVRYIAGVESTTITIGDGALDADGDGSLNRRVSEPVVGLRVEADDGDDIIGGGTNGADRLYRGAARTVPTSATPHRTTSCTGPARS